MSLSLLDALRLSGVLASGLNAGGLLAFNLVGVAALRRQDAMCVCCLTATPTRRSPKAQLKWMSSAFHPGAVFYSTLIIASGSLLGAAAYCTPAADRSTLLPLSRRRALALAAVCEAAIAIFTGQIMADPNTEIKRAADADRDVSESEAKMRIERFAKQHAVRMVLGVAAFLLSAVELVR